MKLGDVLNGYEVVTEPTNAGAGMSQWAVAARDGERYFIKMFLAPKYPLAKSPGSEEGKRKRRAECERFERRQLEIAKRLRSDAPGGGHLVTTLEFFRVGSCYFKVTRLVPTDHRVELHTAPGYEQVIALRSLLFSIKLLHGQGVVHGDLKPENVLFQRTAGGAVTCKLIDFDEAYLSGEPPDRERIVGDPRFYSPELFRYVKHDPDTDPGDLTVASDIFALGLLVHVYLSGTLPLLPEGVGYPCEATVRDLPLVLAIDSLPEPLSELLPAMLVADPATRPDIDAVIEAARAVPLPASPPPVEPTHASPVPVPTRVVPESSAGNAAPDNPGRTKLRSTFGRRNRPPTSA